MHHNQRKIRTLALIFLLIWLVPIIGSGQTRTIYDRYIAAYQAYQDAVTRNAAADEIGKLLEEYKSAKVAYDKELGKPDETKPINDANEAFSDPSTAAIDRVSAGSPLDTCASNAATLTERSGTGMSAELRTIINDLWSAKNRKSPDTIIARLEAFIARNPKSYQAMRAKYELAKAYEWLKKNPAKAAKVLTEIAVSPYSGQLVYVARDRLKALQAHGQNTQWKSFIVNKNTEMNASYKKYRDTSWLAFPVKASRYVGYVAKLWSFNSAKSDYKKFQLQYEALCAPFTPPPEICFDLFKPANGIMDPSGRVRLIYNNFEAWYTRWKILNEARRSIDVQYFIVDDDIFGMSLTGLFLRKAKEGVKIRFMMDARGTKGFTRKLMGQDFIQELVEYPNVEVKVFNPVNQNIATLILDVKKMIASNHDKIVVVDEEYAIVGGRNISKDYFVDSVDHPTAYRDCDVLIQSPEVADALDAAFTEEFAQLKSENIVSDLFGNIDIMTSPMEAAWNAMNVYIRTGRLYAPERADSRTTKALKEFNEELGTYRHMTSFTGFEPMNGSHDSEIKIIDKHSKAGYRNDITDELIRYIDGARREILIQNPYVVLTERAEAALKRAAKRGVRIIMHTNSPISTDSVATQAMFYADWKRLLKEIPTLEIYVYYGQQKLHAKNFVFDGKIGLVGTYNMDYLSEEVNSEVVAAMNSHSFSTELRRGIYQDLGKSKKYEIEVLANGDVKAVFGPDDLKSSKSWMIKTLSYLGFLKPLI
jgi:phosphatidylserine/phosphatidylglycerophosphate/cardiolipin synthase-like enzyme